MDKILDEEYSGRSIEDIAEGIMDVDMPQYSEKKEEMYQAAKAYFEALGQENISGEELQRLKDRADILTSEYSDNPAYGALLQQKYLSKNRYREKNVHSVNCRLCMSRRWNIGGQRRQAGNCLHGRIYCCHANTAIPARASEMYKFELIIFMEKGLSAIPFIYVSNFK